MTAPVFLPFEIPANPDQALKGVLGTCRFVNTHSCTQVQVAAPTGRASA